jgi:Undecaprenyl-phosphate galactose phosphotransferase WbaP
VLGLEVRQNLLMPWPRVAKRLLDLILVVPALLAVALLVVPWVWGLGLFASPGPLFYGQRRIGRGGRPFTCWKFRSMRRDADQALAAHLAADPAARAEWEATHKLKDDPRVTWLGAFLRRYSIDELPQFWNVLRGEMSLAGPRPIVEAEIAKYEDAFALYRQVRPGVTGLWQVGGRNDTSYAERIALDSYYVRNWSVWIDLVILARTPLVALFGRGAY